MSVTRYWVLVRTKREELAERGQFHFLVSIDDPQKNTTGGTIIEAETAIAAECLVRGTHRLATDDEVAAYRAEEERRRQEILEAERRRREELLLRPPQPQVARPRAPRE